MALERSSLGWRNRLLTIALAIAATVAASFIVYALQVPNPVIILVVIMIAFTALGSNIAGAASGLCIVVYALFFFSKNHSFISFSAEGRYKCLVIVVSLIAIYALVAILRKRNDKVRKSLAEANERLGEQNQILRRESDHDVLTGLYNRRGGDARVEQHLAIQSDGIDEGFLAMVAAMDIDDFKYINDAYGHEAGDMALRHFAACLKNAFQTHSVLIRNGGDEFQAFIFGQDGMAVEREIADFSRQTFEFDYQGHEITFTISCGYAAYPRQARTEKELYRKADSALYAAKMTGKHRALPYEEDSDAGARGKAQLSIRTIAEGLPVAFMVYRADGDETVLAVSNSLLELCDCQDFEEFRAYTGGTFPGLVHPDDVEAVEGSIKRQVANNAYEIDTVDYRIVTRTGRIVRVRDIGRLVHDSELGDLFYVAIYDLDSIGAMAERSAV